MIKREFSQKLIMVLENSRNLARANMQQNIETVHVLYALLMSKNSPTPEIVKDLNIETEELKSITWTKFDL